MCGMNWNAFQAVVLFSFRLLLGKIIPNLKGKLEKQQ